MSPSAVPQDVFDQVTRAWAMQDYAWGERLLAEACKRDPDHWHLRTCHAAAIGYCSRFRSARAAFERLIADAPVEKKLHMHGLLGVEWCRIGRHDLAVPLLRIATTDGDAPAPVFEALASALEHLRDLADAREVLAEGLRRYPGHAGMILVRARAERLGGDLDRACQSARELLASPGASPAVKVAAGHELGHALDSQGRYAEAFAAFTAAKRERQPLLAPFDAVWRQAQQLLESAALPTREEFLRWQEQRQTGAPQRLAMLVGCPRSGTTLLERVLDAHPDLISAPETHVFNNLWSLHVRLRGRGSSQLGAIRQIAANEVQALREDYRDQMEDALEQAPGDRLVLDKNPSQLSRVPAILGVLPEAKILMALRDPRAIAWSCFSQLLPDNAESSAFNSLPTTTVHVVTQLQFWQRLRERLPEASWHETRYERMVGDFESETRRTLGFLGLPWQPEVAGYHASSRPVRSPTYAEAARPIYRHALEKWRNYEPFLGDSFQPLQALAQELGYDA